jgi:hypothetical protein
MADPTDGPLEYEEEKPLDPMFMEVLRELSNPNTILFTAKAGGPGALMTALGFATQKIPPQWIKILVRKALIAPLTKGSNKVACMGWIQYVLTYEGQQVLNRGR